MQQHSEKTVFAAIFTLGVLFAGPSSAQDVSAEEANEQSDDAARAAAAAVPHWCCLSPGLPCIQVEADEACTLPPFNGDIGGSQASDFDVVLNEPPDFGTFHADGRAHAISLSMPEATFTVLACEPFKDERLSMALLLCEVDGLGDEELLLLEYIAYYSELTGSFAPMAPEPGITATAFVGQTSFNVPIGRLATFSTKSLEVTQ